MVPLNLSKKHQGPPISIKKNEVLRQKVLESISFLGTVQLFLASFLIINTTFICLLKYATFSPKPDSLTWRDTTWELTVFVSLTILNWFYVFLTALLAFNFTLAVSDQPEARSSLRIRRTADTKSDLLLTFRCFAAVAVVADVSLALLFEDAYCDAARINLIGINSTMATADMWLLRVMLFLHGSAVIQSLVTFEIPEVRKPVGPNIQQNTVFQYRASHKV